MVKDMQRTDVFIVGGGPAGLAAGLAARMAGFDVTVVDHSQMPIDKACGEGIMPDGLAALRRLGVELPASCTAPFRGIRFVDQSGKVDADFAQGEGLGIRRPVLHNVLADYADRAGVALKWGARLANLSQEYAEVNGQAYSFRWLICADGQNSQSRKMAGLDEGSLPRRRFGFRRHYRVAPWSPFVEVHWSDQGQMYITPVSREEICVALITRQQHARFEDALQSFSDLAPRLHGSTETTRLMGAVSSTRRLRAVQKGRVALVGDASGSVDAITGEGLSMAFQQAVALACAMRSGNLLSYEEAHKEIAMVPRAMAGLMLTMDGHPKLRQRVFRAFAAQPEFFSKMLAVHTGDASPYSFGVKRSLAFGWHLLTA